jgi:hypothetical protein
MTGIETPLETYLIGHSFFALEFTRLSLGLTKKISPLNCLMRSLTYMQRA